MDRSQPRGNLAQQSFWTGNINRHDGYTMRIALYQPDIPQNTGTILRLAACLGVAVDIIEPAGFDVTDRALRRAGLDYLDHVAISRHECFETFCSANTGRIILLTSHATAFHHHFKFEPGDTLLLGRESSGVPARVHDRADARLRIAMPPGLRSLNIAVATAIVLGEALRQTGGYYEAPDDI